MASLELYVFLDWKHRRWKRRLLAQTDGSQYDCRKFIFHIWSERSRQKSSRNPKRESGGGESSIFQRISHWVQEKQNHFNWVLWSIYWTLKKSLKSETIGDYPQRFFQSWTSPIQKLGEESRQNYIDSRIEDWFIWCLILAGNNQHSWIPSRDSSRDYSRWLRPGDASDTVQQDRLSRSL